MELAGKIEDGTAGHTDGAGPRNTLLTVRVSQRAFAEPGTARIETVEP
jgi:hypothetical protein